MIENLCNTLKEELKKELPGKKAQVKMAANIRNHFQSNKKTRKAGVLILLYPKNKTTNIVFIQRTEYNGPHSGQISFPGGKYEKSDNNIVETALRESHEEIGLNPENIEIYGQLTPLHIPVSNFIVYPIVGVSKETPVFKADSIEVKKIIEIEIQKLIDPKNCTSKKFNYGDLSFVAPIYNPDNVIIWGATAMILSEFIEIFNACIITSQE